MPQGDLNVANQSGAAFRADMNNQLLALGTNQSGASAPSTTYAYQFWADTTAGLLRIRNGANNDWIVVGSLTDPNLGFLSAGAVVLAAGGTAAAPGFSFSGDTDTGLYRAAANVLGLATDGVERLRVGSTGQLSATVPGGSTLYPGFVCRAWVKFDGEQAGIPIRGSGNVSSISDIDDGIYRVNFTTAMPDANYAAVATSNEAQTRIEEEESNTTSYVSITVRDANDDDKDGIVTVAVFR